MLLNYPFYAFYTEQFSSLPRESQYIISVYVCVGSQHLNLEILFFLCVVCYVAQYMTINVIFLLLCINFT